MMRALIVLVLGLSLIPGLVRAQSATSTAVDLPEAVRQQLRTRIEAQRRGLDALTAAGASVSAADSVLQFYEQRQFAPAWTDRTGPTAAFDSLLAALRRADRDGLHPGDYHVDALTTLRQERQHQRWSPRRLADLELLSTDAFLLYGSHLLTGRVSPTTLSSAWNVAPRQADLKHLLTEAVQTGTVTEALRGLRPPQPEYTRLRNALQRYRRLAAAGGWPTVPAGPTLQMGDEGVPIDSLRRRLRVTGDLSGKRAAAPDTFDRALHEAVVRFQSRHGLAPDGAVGPATRAALNVSATTRVQQIIVNLERWRWLPQDLGRRHVLVNIAGFRLHVIEDGEEVMQMRVITGQPYRQTPVFSEEISYLVFNPYWHVPHSIATEDKLPEIKKDPGYLSRQQIEVFQGWGADAQPVDPATIDWDRLSKDHFPYRLRQKPGPLNALGRVKFMFPNPHSVYLHDTPTRGLFAQAERTFSSGCIRVERPVDLAEYLLTNRTEWPAERIRTEMNGSNAERTVLLREPVPVHLQYWTAWVEADGTVHFRNDVYERDAPLQRTLNEVTTDPESRRTVPGTQ